MKIVNLIRGIKRHGKCTEKDGVKTHRVFTQSSRYKVDFADDFSDEGWEQYDTDQDAEYFGVWINRGKHFTLNYCEGDWTFVECLDADIYRDEIRRIDAFYQPGQVAT